MKENIYRWFVKTFSWLSFGATFVLSIMAAWILFDAGFHSFLAIMFVPIAMAVGGSINVAEVIYFVKHLNLRREWNKLGKILEVNKEMGNLTELTTTTIDKQRDILKKSMNISCFIYCFAAFLSISASFSVFYTTYKHGKELSEITDMQIATIAKKDSTEAGFKHLAKERERIAKERTRYTSYYLDRSADMLAKADSINTMKSAKLDSLSRTNKKNLSISIYESYANLGGSSDFWASLINLFFVILIESVMLGLVSESHRIYLKDKDESKGRTNPDTLYENMTVELDEEGNLYIDVDKVGRKVTLAEQKRTNLLQNRGNGDGKTDSFVTSADSFGTIDDKLRTFIYHVVDNWNIYGTKKRQSLRNIAAIIEKEKKIKISHQTIDRVLKERK